MLKTISRTQKERIETLLNSMSTEQKIGQTLCPIGWPFGKSIDASTADAIISKMRRYVEQYHVGCLFSGAGTIPGFMALQTALKSMSDIPIIVNGDMETGAGRLIKGKHFFPATMMSGAADSVSMVRTVAEATGIESRECGVHWTLAPVADLCLNRSNPMVFSRAYSCCPEHVTRMATTFIRGVQKNGRLAATAKHFPGDGSEDREPHICTAVLDMTRRQWMESYGKVWKAVIDAGVMSIMTGHIGLPFVDPADSYRGPRPAPLSRKIQLDFLRGELGFDGTIVCDAATMIGFAAHAPARDRAWRAIEAGVDVFLFSNPDIDFPNMVLTFCNSEFAQTAAVKAWLGENRIVGKCPVALKGFYTCGVK